ncbi:MAG TPA: nucleotide exchange factor GrpE [Thermoflexia bacterium]|jgi:molecular chaperone GrpE|nr:nucleotide exchange factor GrpE [Thermoflexia bacterium]
MTVPTRKKIPIRVKKQELEERPASPPPAPVEEGVPPVVEAEAVPAPVPSSPPPEGAAEATGTTGEAVEELEKATEELEMWKDRALRLEAEMDNFRKRQRRLAEDRVLADRERLLRAFLAVADDLARALSADGVDAESLRQGVDLTYQSMMRLLSQEGVEPIEAEGQPFDPAWHEAVGTVSHEEAGVEPDTVVEVVQPGYRIGDRLLRPARVIVAT